MQCENNFYLTHDKSLDIEFLFVNLGNEVGWRAYILSSIDYKKRDTSCSTIHRLTESDKHRIELIRRFMHDTRLVLNDSAPIYYICWSTTIHELTKIRELAKTWSEITAYYIKHGGSFLNIQKELKNKGIISF